MTLHSASIETLARLKVVNSTWRAECLVKKYYYLLMKSLEFEYKKFKQLWFKQYFIHKKYIHVSTIHNGTGSDSKQSAYM